METKKTPRADIERERTTYFLIGFIVVLSSFFVLMEWESDPPDSSDWQNLMPAFIESEFIGNIEYKEVPPIEITPENKLPEIVYEGYQVADEVSPPEELFIDSVSDVERILEIPKEEQLAIPQEESDHSEQVYTEAETAPQFPGGVTELIRFIYKNIEYPSVALKQRIEGRVWCSFIVNKDGSISGVEIEKGVYSFLDDEALRVLKLMPNWLPGKKDDEPVRVKVYVPIVFKR